MSKLPLSFLKFDPIVKDKVWGGNKLRDMLHKEAGTNAGESWEISGVAGSISTVSGGPHHGKSLQQMLEDHKHDLVGKHVYERYANDFPLLFKFIDAADDLSVQLHPNDKLARERHNSFGKTEMWYIVDCDPNSRLILGFNSAMDAETYSEVMKEGRITEVLNEEIIAAGDSYFIATGTVHALCKGTLLAEIQQTSDITYRIYDWDRPDQHGELRELHTEEAIAAIDYDARGAKLDYQDIPNKAVNLCSSDYFITNRIAVNGIIKRDLDGLDSFKVYMCVDGMATMDDGRTIAEVRKGDSILVPASVEYLEISSDNAVLLEVYIP